MELAARVRRAATIRLRPPLLTQESAAQYPFSVSEVILMMLRRDGRSVGSWGWPTRATEFFDRMQAGVDGLQGRPRPSEIGVRLVDLPLPSEALYLYFYRADLVQRSDRTAGPLEWRPRGLALYHTAAPGDPPPPLPVDLPGSALVSRAPQPLPFVERTRERVSTRRPEPPNRIDSVRTLIDNGPPEDHFDIVILGEGFTEGELGNFDDRANEIATRLLRMPPFETLASRINIHAVRTVSTDSGITDCPKPGVRKNTFFDARGNFNGLFPAFVGVDDPERVYAAAEQIAPREFLDLFLVIANCTTEGGSAFPDLSLAFVTMWQGPARFVNIAAHEMAHVIARTAEEYIGCEVADPMQRYPNQGTDAERLAGTLPWRLLARPPELDGNGGFRAVHLIGDPFDGNNEPVVDPDLRGMLGAYWGCQDIEADPKHEGDCDPFQDPRGANFFRGMARCRMRRSSFDFCRVCADRITRVICEIAP